MLDISFVCRSVYLPYFTKPFCTDWLNTLKMKINQQEIISWHWKTALCLMYLKQKLNKKHLEGSIICFSKLCYNDQNKWRLFSLRLMLVSPCYISPGCSAILISWIVTVRNVCALTLITTRRLKQTKNENNCLSDNLSFCILWHIRSFIHQFLDII